MKTRYKVIQDLSIIETNGAINRNFVRDMIDVRDGRTPCRIEVDDDKRLRIYRTDGHTWRHGSPDWIHDNKRYPIFIKVPLVTLDEGLFEL